MNDINCSHELQAEKRSKRPSIATSGSYMNIFSVFKIISRCARLFNDIVEATRYEIVKRTQQFIATANQYPLHVTNEIL